MDYEYDARGRLIALERRYGAAEDDDQPGQGAGPPDNAGPPGFTPPGHARRGGGSQGSNPDWGPSGVANYAYDALGRRAARAVATDSGATHETRTSYRGMGFDIAADHQPLRGPGPDWLRIPGESGDHPGGQHGNSGFRAESIHIQVAGRTVSEHPAPEGRSTLGEANVREARREVAGGSWRSATAGPETARNYHHDVRGSVRYISATGGRGAPGGAVDYDAFGLPAEGLDRFAQSEGRGPAYGQRADKHGKLNEGYGYTGKRLDPMLGGYDYGFRHYGPSVGRFLTEDPIKDGSNWYAYVANDPVNFVDPRGLEAVDVEQAVDAWRVRDPGEQVYAEANNRWIENPDGTYTARPGATLYGLFGDDWREKSGFEGDPTDLQPGDTVPVRADRHERPTVDFAQASQSEVRENGGGSNLTGLASGTLNVLGPKSWLGQRAAERTAALNVSRTLRDSQGNLMRHTRALRRRALLRNVGRQAKRLAPGVSVALGVAAIGVDEYRVQTGRIGRGEFVYGTVANVLSMWPGPAVSAVGVGMNLSRGFLFD